MAAKTLQSRWVPCSGLGEMKRPSFNATTRDTIVTGPESPPDSRPARRPD
jgi:hypothetical protein